MSQLLKRSLQVLPLLFFSAFVSVLWQDEVRQIQFQGEDASQSKLFCGVVCIWADHTSTLLLPMVKNRHFRAVWPHRLILESHEEHEELYHECACISLWTMPGCVFHQKNPMLSTFWYAVRICYLMKHGKNFHYLSLTRSNYAQKKFHSNHLADSVKA